MYEIIDLHFQGQPEIIASYVLRGPSGVALIETGPRSSADNLVAGLRALGIDLADITDILVTHIHLDHAGAAGWLAQETGAPVYVHEIGAPHLADPNRLLTSARRIYGDLMDPLWGETLPVPADQVHALKDGDIVEAAGLRLTALDTPGHAYHHMAYLLDGLCFSGDVAAVRLPGYDHIRLPTPPPEINPPLWHKSLARLREINPEQLLLTHFGPVGGNVREYLDGVGENLDAYIEFFYPRWQAGETVEAMSEAFRQWVAEQAAADGCDSDAVHRYEVVVPSYMQAGGLARYFKKREA